MKKLLVLLLCTWSVRIHAQDSGKFFNYLKLGYSKGFKAYGLNDIHFRERNGPETHRVMKKLYKGGYDKYFETLEQ